MQIEIFFGESSFQTQDLGGPAGTLEISEDPLCSFGQFLKIVSGDELEFMPKNYKRLSEHFVSSSHVAPLLLPRSVLKASVKKAESFMQDYFSSSESSSYLQNWLKINDFLKSLHRAKVNSGKLQVAAAGVAEGQRRVIETFTPDSSGFAKRVVYNTAGSVTGRLTVESGPQVLTAPKKVRSCIESRFECGKIYEVDFRSIEPRVAMIFMGIPAPDDVYQDLLEEFPALTREAAKAVTLTALYGGQPARISEVVGDLGTARKSVSFVRSHFRVEGLERQLEAASLQGSVRNALGRPLREATRDQRVRTNHFLQSTAAELSILLFSEMCAKVPAAVPVFVIHDALIADVPCEQAESFESACNSAEWLGTKMPVSFHDFSNI